MMLDQEGSVVLNPQTWNSIIISGKTKVCNICKMCFTFITIHQIHQTIHQKKKADLNNSIFAQAHLKMSCDSNSQSQICPSITKDRSTQRKPHCLQASSGKHQEPFPRPLNKHWKWIDILGSIRKQYDYIKDRVPSLPFRSAQELHWGLELLRGEGLGSWLSSRPQVHLITNATALSEAGQACGRKTAKGGDNGGKASPKRTRTRGGHAPHPQLQPRELRASSPEGCLTDTAARRVRRGLLRHWTKAPLRPPHVNAAPH